MTRSSRSIEANFSHKLAERESQYMTTEELRIFCGTFNVNGKHPDEDLRPWFFLNQDPVDIYAIGFQEVVELSTTSYMLQSDWAERELRWIQVIDNELCNCTEESFNLKAFLRKSKRPPKYRRVVKYRMFGLLLLIYVSDRLNAECISEIFTSEVPTGIMDTLGNKGSIGISFKVNETRLCFVCSHFASDTDKLQKRNSDYRSTKQRMKFEYNANLDYYDLDNHDVVYWFGDLNYRLDKVSLNQTIEKIYSNEIDALIEFDQLTNQRSKMCVFDDYSEGKINFRPTYKYIVKQDIYEKQLVQKAAIKNNDLNQQNDHNNSAVKVKLPSWTDRILWKALNCRVKLVQYSCINTITISDHKPVYALFDMDVKKIDEKKFNKIYDSLLKDSDRKVNDEMPRISVENFEYRFEDCMYYDQKSLQLSVKNEGVTRSNVDIQYYDPSLAEIGNESLSYETDQSIEISRQHQRSAQHRINQWCTINPQHKERLEPAAQYTIEVSTNFNQNVLPRFNTSQTVDDFLIVRCLNGNDIFVTLSCEYVPTIIGFSIKTLSTLEEPFDKYGHKELHQTHEAKLNNFETNLNSIWLHSLKILSSCLQEKNAEKLFGNLETLTKPPGKQGKTKFYSDFNEKTVTNEEASVSKIELYKTLLLNLKEELIDKDEYFHNKLSSEYTFLMQHLIDRCSSNLDLVNTKTEANTSNNRDSSFKIEDQKNLILALLSAKNFEKFREENFDLELLAEVLYDLLYALPNPVIPTRFIDVFMYMSNDYETCLRVFDYIPKSHFQLFEMLIKFLQIYLKCLATCDSNLNSLIANGLFKINVTSKESSDIDNKEFYKSQTASKLVKLFIENHREFKTI